MSARIASFLPVPLSIHMCVANGTGCWERQQKSSGRSVLDSTRTWLAVFGSTCSVFVLCVVPALMLLDSANTSAWARPVGFPLMGVAFVLCGINVYFIFE